MQRALLLKSALPLISSHGFTREALARAALSLPTPHEQPLNDAAVSALFGRGDEARRTLINEWLLQGRMDMRNRASEGKRPLNTVLKERLQWNEPVLQYLPEAFSLLVSSDGIIPRLNPTPLLSHAAQVADEACYAVGETAPGMTWYTRRASLASVYAAAELHQLTSPRTAYDFLDSLLSKANSAESTLHDTAEFVQYVGQSWRGIIKSWGL